MKLKLDLRKLLALLPRGVIAIVSSVGVSTASAQTAPTLPAAEEPLVLSPFEVTTKKDVGYTAASSAMGGRLNLALADTAASVTILNQEFLQDLGITNQAEASVWGPNTTNQYRDAANPFQDYAVQVRGLGPTYQTTKNFFRYYFNADAFFTERIDFGRGPNSLVFGDTGAAGTFNTSSKRARGKALRLIEVQHFSDGGYRAGLDVNQPLSEKFQVRGVYVKQNSNGWQDFEQTKYQGASGTFTWKVFPRTTIWGEYEYHKRETTSANGVYDLSSSWDGTTVNSTGALAANPAASTGLQRISANNPYMVFNSAQPDMGLMNWSRFAQTNGPNIRMAPEGWDAPDGWGLPSDARNQIPSIPRFGYSANFQEPNFMNKLRGATIVIEHQFSDKLFAEVGLNRVWSETSTTNLVNNMRQVRVDVNQVLPNGEANPYFGQSYVESRNTLPQQQFRDPLEGRFSLAYIDNFRLAEVNALVGYSFRNDPFEIVRNLEGYTLGANPNLAHVSNRVYYRRYLSELDAPYIRPPDVTLFKAGKFWPRSTRNERFNRSWQAMVSTKWFESRKLLTSIGFRRENTRTDEFASVADPVTTMFSSWGATTRTLDADTDNVNYNAIYRVTDWLSLYASYGESFEFSNSASTIAGGLHSLVTAKGPEFGARFRLFGDKVNASVVYYDTERLNQRLNGKSGDINAIWTDLGISDRDVVNYSDTQAWHGTGWEFELVANPTKNLRLMLNFALPEATQIAGFPDTRAYFDANVAAWRSGAEQLGLNGDPSAEARINQNIVDIETALSGFAEGRKLNDTYDYTANVFANYTFSSGKLKGFSIGGGANARGDRVIGNEQANSFAYIYGEGYITMTAQIGYTHRLRNGTLTFQVNVKNLLDEQTATLQNNGYGSNAYIDETGVARSAFGPRAYTVEPPRSFTFTARYQF